MTDPMMNRAEAPLTLGEWFTYQARRLLTGLCWVVFGVGGLLLTFLWFPYLNLIEKNPERRIRLARQSISATFRFFIGMINAIGVAHIDIEGVKRLQHVKGAIIVANHPTILDYVMIAAALPRVDCLVKSALKTNIFLKGVVAAADYMLNDHSEALLAECEARLKKGDNILIFPEGTRTVPGEPLTLKRGVAHIALRLHAPIEVLFVEAPDRWLSKGCPWWAIPKRRGTLKVRYLTRLDPKVFDSNPQAGYSRSSRALTAALKATLQAECDRVHAAPPFPV